MFEKAWCLSLIGVKDELGIVLLCNFIKDMGYVGHRQVESTLNCYDQRVLARSMIALSLAYTQFTNITKALSDATAHFVFRGKHDTHVMAVENYLPGGMLGEACIAIEIPPVELISI